MPSRARFKVRRKDSDKIVDDALIDKQELRIGRQIENDLVLNDPAVAPVHAIIGEKRGSLWIVDTLDSHATLLNGQTISEEPLLDGDVIQIGPYSLRVDHEQDAILVSVERKLTVFPLKAPMSQPAGARRRDPAPLALLEDQEQEALRIFWQTRRREAGKLVGSTPLCPAGIYGIGKARFNWRPTLDLKLINRKLYLAAACAAVVIASICAWLAWREVYSPAPLSTAHASSEMSGKGIALSGVSSCSDCHHVFGNMQENCTRCHDAPGKAGSAARGFNPGISTAHQAANIGCAGCHSEHNGADFRPKDVNNDSCMSCHNDRYRFNGRILGAPHKGPDGLPAVGYIRVNDAVKWKDLTGQPAIVRFHVDHPYAGTKCGYCHAGTLGTAEWKETPKSACKACHAVSFTTTGIKPIGPNCATCHRQHGKDKDLTVAVSDITDTERRKILAQVRSRGLDSLLDTTESFTAATIGGAGVKRQGQAAWNWNSASKLGVIPWYVWAAPLVILGLAGIAVIVIGNTKRKQSLLAESLGKPAVAPTDQAEQDRNAEEDRPGIHDSPYPHPKIDTETCIGCYACIEACPHDVLAMNFDEVAALVAPTQCMDDTGCQAACPTGACVVVNTQRKIPEREMPDRDPKSFVTNVSGIYVIGDVSRVPLIKNAINEGADVIDCIKEDLKKEESGQLAEYDVAIVGAGAAGLSAALMAKHNGLSYIALEQNKVLATIQGYPAGKNVNFKPDSKQAKGLLSNACAATNKKEAVVELCRIIMRDNEVEIRENETCKQIKKENEIFTVVTAKGETGAGASYTARRIILAIGSNGTPKKLGVKGEDQKISIELPKCQNCGTPCQPLQGECALCNASVDGSSTEVVQDYKVKYRLSDPSYFTGKKCVVVGGGNSAIEAAVALTGFKRSGEEITFTRDNEVTLLIRTDFTPDLKFGNKMNLFDCWDAGKIDVLFRTEIKDIETDQVVVMNDKKKESGRIPNDYVFLLIGSQWPKSFLKESGIEILKASELAARRSAARRAESS